MKNKYINKDVTSKSKIDKLSGVHCLYCGAPVSQQAIEINANTHPFAVCCSDCKDKAEKYIKQDKTFKILLYVMICIAAMIFILSAIFGGEKLSSFLTLIISGIGFILFPHPVSYIETFSRYSIRKIKFLSRSIGFTLAIFGVILIAVLS